MAVQPSTEEFGYALMDPQSASYKWEENGTGGVNYFLVWNGQTYPITREEFQAGVATQGDTQTDVGALEQWAANRYQPGEQTATYTGPTASEIAAVNKSWQLAKTNIQNALDEGLININEARTALKNTREGLALKKDEGFTNNAMLFGAVSPDAYQSQQGVYNKKVLDSYEKNMGNLAGTDEKINLAEKTLRDQIATQNWEADQARTAGTKSTGSGAFSFNYTPIQADTSLASNAIAQTTDPSLLAAYNSSQGNQQVLNYLKR